MTCLESGKNMPALVAEWTTLWDEVFGVRPETIVSVQAAKVTGLSQATENAADQMATSQSVLSQVFDLYGSGNLQIPMIDSYLTLTSAMVVRSWASWLRQFAKSSHHYLLSNLLRRRGYVTDLPYEILVQAESMPLDIVLDLAGYTGEIGHVSWLSGRPVRFRMEDAR